jgi:hypothetical protein
MVRSEFEALWSLPDKCVNEDIVFIPHRSIPGVFVFEDVEVIHTRSIGCSLMAHTTARWDQSYTISPSREPEQLPVIVLVPLSMAILGDFISI